MATIAETFLACRRHDCKRQANTIIVTINEGFCFERCADCARRAVLPW